MSTPRTPGVPIPVDDTGRLPIDIACASCLRRLERAEIGSRCPKCGESARVSAEASVALAPPPWHGRLCAGLLVLIGAGVVRAAASVLLEVLNGLAVRSENDAVREAASRLAMLETSVPGVAGHALLLAFAYFWLTSPPAGRLRRHLDGPLRRATALLLMLHVVAPLIAGLVANGIEPSSSVEIVVVAFDLAAHFALLTYLAHLAARIPNRDLVLYALVLRWMLLLPPLLAQICVGFGWLSTSGQSDHSASIAGALSAIDTVVAFALFVFYVLLARQIIVFRARRRQWSASLRTSVPSGLAGDSTS
jgi:hypothetical protein